MSMTELSETQAHPAQPPLLEVQSLRTTFSTVGGEVRSVDGLSFTLEAGRTLGVVGESGCGKSVSALSILRLVPTPPARHSGAVLYKGDDLMQYTEAQMRGIRGNRISMIFQEPMTSLNPVMTIGRQIEESVRLHQRVGKRESAERALQMLRIVQIPEPQRRAREYPHQLSGGMRQRVMIAMALACNPEVLIADEPTTALDVTIQAQILDLVRELQQQFGMGVIMITHDLGVVAESCDRVIVMYAGRKVEEADVRVLFARPLHPYTRALMASMPSLNTRATRLSEIAGLVPSPTELGLGCAFAPRCAHANQRCFAEDPVLSLHGDGHVVACFGVDEGRISLAAQPPEMTS